MGHPIAQHWVAQAHASGIWPIVANKSELLLQVQTTFLSGKNNQQQSKAWLYWHMAALAGHVEASMALLAAQIEQQEQQQSGYSCQVRLAYYQAAAHGIMDVLEMLLQSCAKVAPPMDQHILYQIQGVLVPDSIQATGPMNPKGYYNIIRLKPWINHHRQPLDWPICIIMDYTVWYKIC